MKKFFPKFGLCLILLIISCNDNNPNYTESSDSLLILRSFSKKELTNPERHKILDSLYQETPLIKNDTLKNEILLEISYQFLKIDDSAAFLKVNQEARELAGNLNDSTIIAATYWDLGRYYQAQNLNDSAYYYYSDAQKIYEQTKNNYSSARLLLNMAMVQKDAKDYTGSEITTTKAITIFKELGKHKQLFSAYNNLGIIFNELEEYDRALFYHEKALENLEQTEFERFIPMGLNNLGVVYENKGHYSSAIRKYEEALNYDSLYQENPKLYAMLLDNLGYAKFKAQDTAQLPGIFYEALRIRDSLNHYDGISINKLHLSEYFLGKKDTVKALRYSKEALNLSKNSHNNRDYLSSLLVLSEADTENAANYMATHIKLSDSLQKIDRATRNKFARIRFETDEYISETKRLNQRVLRISLISVGVLLVLGLLYIIKDQRSKNKVIKIKEKANQEIYSLILAQQKNFEEGREREKQHISRELHDGILGKLFGIRLSLDSLNEEDTKEIKKKRRKYIEEIQTIAEEIRLISHKLNKSSIVDVDFKIVLKELIKKQRVNTQLNVDSSIDWDFIGNDIKINFYRIIQEAFNNIHKHSKATEVKVVIKKTVNSLILQVRDNGVGFNTSKLNNGIGLKNMKSRSRDINGSFLINSSSKGTLIEVEVDLKN